MIGYLDKSKERNWPLVKVNLNTYFIKQSQPRRHFFECTGSVVKVCTAYSLHA